MRFASVVGVIALLSSVSMAKSIEVCVIPLQHIVQPLARLFVGSLQHMFIRNADGTGLNFEPVNPMGFLDDRARIGRRGYSSATCRPIFTTDNEKDYDEAWRAIEEAYDHAAATRRYSIVRSNCQHVTRAILRELGYAIPKEIEDILRKQF